jgi:hypothetical protein
MALDVTLGNFNVMPASAGMTGLWVNAYQPLY